MYFYRYYEEHFAEYLEPGKVLVIFGPRQAGKTTMVERYLRSHANGGKHRFDTGDNAKIQTIFASRDLETLLAYVEGYDLLILDEAQRIPHVGLGLKLLVDHRPDLRIIATGSSSFELAHTHALSALTDRAPAAVPSPGTPRTARVVSHLRRIPVGAHRTITRCARRAPR